MGPVTGPARFFVQHLMYYFFFVVFPFVALVADFFAFRLKKIIRLGCVRLMAVGAFSSFQSCMHHRFSQSYFLFFMASIAYLIPSFLEYQLWDYAMPQVAFLAFFFLDRGVYIFHFEVFVCKLFVTIQAFFADKRSFSGLGRTGREVNNPANEKYYANHEIYPLSIQ